MLGRITSSLRLIILVFLLSSCTTIYSQPDLPNLPRQRIVQIPAGWFLMGENNGRKSNQPKRRVYIDDFEIHVAEVPRQDFVRFITATSYQAPGWIPSLQEETDHLPVVGVLWEPTAVC